MSRSRSIRKAEHERRQVKLVAVQYRSGPTHLMTMLDRPQAMTVLGIISQPLPARRATGTALGKAIRALKREHPGTRWHGQTIGVRLTSIGGVVSMAPHPIVGRVALLAEALCFTDCALEHAIRQLERFVAFGDVPYIHVGELSLAAAETLRAAA